MVYTPVPTRGGPAPRIAVFGIRAGAFDPICGGPERIAAARGPGSVRSGSRPMLRGRFAADQLSIINCARLTFTGWAIAARGSRPVGFGRWYAARGPACLTGQYNSFIGGKKRPAHWRAIGSADGGLVLVVANVLDVF